MQGGYSGRRGGRSDQGNLRRVNVGPAYLERRGRYEDRLAIQYLRACLKSAFSFLDVLSVSPGTGFTMRDCLTGMENSVIEKSASQMVKKG